jgi:hypothetical protein
MRPMNILFATLSFISSSIAVTVNAANAPVAKVKNGTYVGRYAAEWNTDYFLGMRYAQPPLGSLRFHTPVSLNSSWPGSRNATQYGYECYGYGFDTVSQGNYVSEDCLTINVVRSRGSGEGLPVVVSGLEFNPGDLLKCSKLTRSIGVDPRWRASYGW